MPLNLPDPRLDLALVGYGGIAAFHARALRQVEAVEALQQVYDQAVARDGAGRYSRRWEE